VTDYLPPWVPAVLRHFRGALEEFVYLLIFGLMSVWLSSVIQLLFGSGIFSHLGDYLYSGEALLLSVASIGPLMYLMLKNYDPRAGGFSRSFPGRSFLAPIIIVICLISAGIFGVKNVSETLITSKDVLWAISLFVSIVSVIVWMAVTMIRNALDDAAPRIMRQDTEDFVNQWQS